MAFQDHQNFTDSSEQMVAICPETGLVYSRLFVKMEQGRATMVRQYLIVQWVNQLFMAVVIIVHENANVSFLQVAHVVGEQIAGQQFMHLKCECEHCVARYLVAA